jgi:hypothetical protein
VEKESGISEIGKKKIEGQEEKHQVLFEPNSSLHLSSKDQGEFSWCLPKRIFSPISVQPAVLVHLLPPKGG